MLARSLFESALPVVAFATLQSVPNHVPVSHPVARPSLQHSLPDCPSTTPSSPWPPHCRARPGPLARLQPPQRRKIIVLSRKQRILTDLDPVRCFRSTAPSLLDNATCPPLRTPLTSASDEENESEVEEIVGAEPQPLEGRDAWGQLKTASRTWRLSWCNIVAVIGSSETVANDVILQGANICQFLYLAPSVVRADQKSQILVTAR